MQDKLPENLLKLADVCQFPLYIVGGSVRDFLAGFPLPAQADWDICAPIETEALIEAANACNITVKAVYPRTGTVKLKDRDGVEYEFTRFRTDSYERGYHAPAEVRFTQEIEVDARRRDFCANAVYFDIKKGEFLDPLGGIADIQKRRLRTVDRAEKVFGEDGLRLMRLGRLAAQTGFEPDEACLQGASLHAALVKDAAPERIFAETRLLLHADEVHHFPDAPYRGLEILSETRILDGILPELTLGRGMAQNPAYHDHDVLEHSLRCVRYASPAVRLAALLHDVGKPFCRLRDGNFYRHAEEGARLTRAILTRLKAPHSVTERTARLVLLHMRDVDGEMREGKIRRELIDMLDVFFDLLALKQADYSACKDKCDPAPVVQKWEAIYAKMCEEGVPFTPSRLAVNGREIQAAGVHPEKTGEVVRALLLYCAEDGRRNEKNGLLARIEKLYSTD